MDSITLLDRSLETGCRLRRGEVAQLAGSDSAVVRFNDGDELYICDLLYTGSARLDLVTGDEVLICQSERSDQRPIVLGRIGVRRPLGSADPTVGTADPANAPDELVLEARQSLTLRVGDGSITIRADGRILIKGRDVVSHARNTNRIKGGAVAIN